MKNLQEIYQSWQYQDGHGDKGTAHSYIPEYEKLLFPYKNKAINMLEIGVAYGESLELWYEYFPQGKIYGVDIHDKEIKPYLSDPRFKIWINDATKPEFVEVLGDLTFDIIIDDGSHHLDHQLESFNLLKHKINKGGVYIIEDVENLDLVIPFFKDLHDNIEIIDLREQKQRYDDVLIAYKF
jgi:cephalosporin hydroxylase